MSQEEENWLDVFFKYVPAQNVLADCEREQAEYKEIKSLLLAEAKIFLEVNPECHLTALDLFDGFMARIVDDSAKWVVAFLKSDPAASEASRQLIKFAMTEMSPSVQEESLGKVAKVMSRSTLAFLKANPDCPYDPNQLIEHLLDVLKLVLYEGRKDG